MIEQSTILWNQSWLISDFIRNIYWKCPSFNVSILFISEAKEVFELFDFWDGRDAEVDASKIGDVIRCVGLNPTLEIVRKNGGTDKMGKSFQARSIGGGGGPPPPFLAANIFSQINT